MNPSDLLDIQTAIESAAYAQAFFDWVLVVVFVFVFWLIKVG